MNVYYVNPFAAVLIVLVLYECSRHVCTSRPASAATTRDTLPLPLTACPHRRPLYARCVSRCLRCHVSSPASLVLLVVCGWSALWYEYYYQVEECRVSSDYYQENITSDTNSLTVTQPQPQSAVQYPDALLMHWTDVMLCLTVIVKHRQASTGGVERMGCDLLGGVRLSYERDARERRSITDQSSEGQSPTE
jgi:hypothetical protein